MRSRTSSVGPGICKVRRPRPFCHRAVRLVRTAPALWYQLLEGADVVSEGMTSVEHHRLVYRGSTSLVLRGHQEGTKDTAAAAQLAAVAACDPELRLHLVRLARREAVTRAQGQLGSLRVELAMRADGSAVRVDIDVEGAVWTCSLGAGGTRC